MSFYCLVSDEPVNEFAESRSFASFSAYISNFLHNALKDFARLTGNKPSLIGQEKPEDYMTDAFARKMNLGKELADNIISGDVEKSHETALIVAQGAQAALLLEILPYAARELRRHLNTNDNIHLPSVLLIDPEIRPEAAERFRQSMEGISLKRVTINWTREEQNQTKAQLSRAVLKDIMQSTTDNFTVKTGIFAERDAESLFMTALEIRPEGPHRPLKHTRLQRYSQTVN